MTIIENLQTRFALDIENPAHAAVRAGLNRASWGSAKNLTTEHKQVVRALITGSEVDIKEIVAMIVAGLHTSVTRWGQSMARRQGSQPLIDLYNLLPTTSGPVSEIESAHRARVEQEQARTITTLREQSNQRGRTILTQQQEIERLRRDLRAAQYNLDAVRPQAADVAAQDFAFDLLTPEQRQRVSDFRTGYRAAQR